MYLKTLPFIWLTLRAKMLVNNNQIPPTFVPIKLTPNPSHPGRKTKVKHFKEPNTQGIFNIYPEKKRTRFCFKYLPKDLALSQNT